MNVLVVAQYFPPDLGGSATRAYNVARGLRLNRCNVTVLTAFPHYPYGKIPKEYRWKPLRVELFGNMRVIRTFILPLESRGFGSRLLLMGVFAVSSLFALPFVGKVDAIWASSWAPATVYAKVKGKPVAFNVDDLTVEDMPRLNLMKRNFVLKVAEHVYGFFYRLGDAITPISPGYVGTICEKYGVDGSRVHVVEVGVDLNIFRNEIVHRDRGKVFKVLYAGVLGVGYDFEQIFGAAKTMEKKERDVEFVLHGGGESLEYVRKRIRELGLTNVVLSDEVFGSRREVVSLLNDADALILPLRDYHGPYSGLPSKLYEYQAVGKPIICCAEGQPAEYISKTNSGVVVKPGDHEALVKAVVYLKENSDLAQMMGEEGRKYVENNLSVEIIGSKLKAVLENLQLGKE